MTMGRVVRRLRVKGFGECRLDALVVAVRHRVMGTAPEMSKRQVRKARGADVTLAQKQCTAAYNTTARHHQIQQCRAYVCQSQFFENLVHRLIPSIKKTFAHIYTRHSTRHIRPPLGKHCTAEAAEELPLAWPRTVFRATARVTTCATALPPKCSSRRSS